MPEIRHGDDHRVDARICHDALPLFDDADAFIRTERLGPRNITRVKIADDADLGAWDVLHRLQKAMALRPDTNAGHADLVVGICPAQSGGGAVGREGQAGASESGGFQKRSTIDGVHGVFLTSSLAFWAG